MKMKSLVKSPFLAWVLTLAIAVGIAPSPALAQVIPLDVRATPVSITHAAVSKYVPMMVIYVGSEASATVEASAGGDITFKHGALSSEAADTTIECDASIAASGSRNGILDLSTPDAQCDTMGEIVDIINDSANWKAVLLDAKRSSATDNVFITLSATSASTADGVGLLGDGTVSLIDPIALVPLELRSMKAYINRTGSSGAKLKPDPYAGYVPVFFYANTTTTTTGTSTYGIDCIRATYDPATNNGSETVVVSVSGIAGGATTALKEHTLWNNWGFQCPRNTKMIARATNTTDMTAMVHVAYGKLYPVPTR